MRGTKSNADFETFVEAVSGFPPTRRDGMSPQEVFQHSYDLLKGLVAKEPPFPRARAWLAYALALSVSEGWPLTSLPEKNMTADQRVEKAYADALAATKLEPEDYDLWWAQANVQLIRGQFKKEFFVEALASFKEAIRLNRDEQNPNLFAEYADALIHLGDHIEADKQIRMAVQKPDWHHWVRAWAYFMNAGRFREAESIFLDHALDEVKSTKAQPGDPRYLLEIQLLLAAIHARKADLVTGDRADKHKAAVKRAMKKFLAVFPYWDKVQTARFAPFQVDRDGAYWKESIDKVWAIKDPS